MREKLQMLARRRQLNRHHFAKAHVQHLREPLGEEAVAVDLDELTVAVAARQLNDQLLRQRLAQRRLARAWRT